MQKILMILVASWSLTGNVLACNDVATDNECILDILDGSVISEGSCSLEETASSKSAFQMIFKHLPEDCLGEFQLLDYYSFNDEYESYKYYVSYQCMHSSASHEAFYGSVTFNNGRQISLETYANNEKMPYLIDKINKSDCYFDTVDNDFFLTTNAIFLTKKNISSYDVLTGEIKVDGAFCKIMM